MFVASFMVVTYYISSIKRNFSEYQYNNTKANNTRMLVLSLYGYHRCMTKLLSDAYWRTKIITIKFKETIRPKTKILS